MCCQASKQGGRHARMFFLNIATYHLHLYAFSFVQKLKPIQSNSGFLESLVFSRSDSFVVGTEQNLQHLIVTSQHLYQ
jgi:hypothetical protein